MLSTMTDAFGEIVEHAATVRQAGHNGHRISEFDHPSQYMLSFATGQNDAWS